MENKDKDNSFSCTYSAKQQEEIKKIRQKYIPKEEDKMEQLRRLDKSAERTGTICSLVIGIIGTLIFGGGMSLSMTQENMILGIPIGIVGIILALVAYPLYTFVTKKQRQKISAQIIKLTDELIEKK